MLAAQLGYEGSLSLGALEDEVRFYQQRTVESCMEIGKRLLLIKEQTPHGEFNKRIEILNFTPRMAQKFMSAVLKFSKTNSNSLLQKAGNQTKLLELVMLDDDEIELLDQGGSIGDVNLDSIETMSVRELKLALREAKADSEAKDKLIQSKDQKINKLDTELSKSTSQAQILKKQETEQQQLTASSLETLHTACLTMHNSTARFVNEINSVLAAIEEHGLYSIQEQLEANVVAAFQQIAQTSVELGIQIDFEAMVNPEWMSVSQTQLDPASELES
ncbi:DUF3102 domain-containing protein [Acinetobacter ursingii]|nr:DUF3102 domain-containing protein [Acinetobacter ursingii]MDG9993309.1 DUF3102 domain-containing protein [Acinetobacter ursingii]MDH0205467.1 DUF3102 domain-containing protein [Acinetobacter ursingii]